MTLTPSVSSGQSNIRSEYFACQCESFDHSIRFAFDPTEDDIRFLEVWVEAAFPSRWYWWQRLSVAAKYVWTGHRDWTCGSWILKHEDETRLRAFFREYDLRVWELKQKGKNEPVKTDSV